MPYVRADITLIHSSLFKFTFALNSILIWKLLLFKFLVDISEISEPSVCSSSNNYVSARCTSAGNVVYRDIDVFGTKAVSLNYIL
jgi:hypothetical protein